MRPPPCSPWPPDWRPSPTRSDLRQSCISKNRKRFFLFARFSVLVRTAELQFSRLLARSPVFQRTGSLGNHIQERGTPTPPSMSLGVCEARSKDHDEREAARGAVQFSGPPHCRAAEWARRFQGRKEKGKTARSDLLFPPSPLAPEQLRREKGEAVRPREKIAPLFRSRSAWCTLHSKLRRPTVGAGGGGPSTDIWVQESQASA